jgi:hypothetical protein
MSHSRSELASIALVVALLAVTGTHHVFRLGMELTIPTLIAIALAIGLWGFYGKTRKPALLTAYGAYTALLVFWFGFLDGFLDHVFKASGLDNVTFLPGSEAEVVSTVMQLWSRDASTAFYEGTGIASAVLALAATLATGAFIYRELSPKPSAA